MNARLRQWMKTIGTAAVLWALCTAQAWAGGVGPLVLAQQDEGTVIVDSSRSYTLDVFIVIVLFGLALFSVCRSSRRV